MASSSEQRKELGAFVNKPFIKWHKMTEMSNKHAKAQYHQDCTVRSENLMHSIEHPETAVRCLVSEQVRANIQTNRHILRFIVEAVLYCCKQGIGLRGHDERLLENVSTLQDADINETSHHTSKNIGNFLSLLVLMSNHDPILKKHLFVIGLSPLTGITSKVKDAQFYSIMADEVTTHCVEELALCLRYVDDNKDAQEDFVGFIRLPRITGEVIATQILNQLEALGLDPAKIRGQGYDGASNMSSDNVGVQARIKEKSPKVAFIHCSGHCLNLVISHSCQVLGIRNAIDKIQASVLLRQSEENWTPDKYDRRTITVGRQAQSSTRTLQNKVGSETRRIFSLLPSLCVHREISRNDIDE